MTTRPHIAITHAVVLPHCDDPIATTFNPFFIAGHT